MDTALTIVQSLLIIAGIWILYASTTPSSIIILTWYIVVALNAVLLLIRFNILKKGNKWKQ